MGIISRVSGIAWAFVRGDHRQELIQQLAGELGAIRDVVEECERALRVDTARLRELAEKDGSPEARQAWRAIYSSAIKLQSVRDQL